MSQITIDSHDFLGKLSIIKNHLFLVLEGKDLPAGKVGKLSEKTKKLLKLAYQTNEELISQIKKLTKS